LPLALLAAAGIVFAWSAIAPHDRLTWFLEIAPLVVAVPLLWLTWRRFPLSPLVYVLIALHAVILMVGGHYTYAQVPLGFWAQEALGTARNHYDRLGHFAQGFVPAMIAREVYLRRTPLRRGGWLFFFVACTCLAISAFYEFTEWWAALAGGESATAFLGTQGDVWDTQWDMFLALLGSLTAQLTLAGLHDRQLRRLGVGI
jgi:putative membrane protein